MKLARASVIVKPISDVGVLLDFAQGKAAADSVDRAGRDEKRIAGLNLDPVQQPLNLAADRRIAQALVADRFAKANRNARPRVRAERRPFPPTTEGSPRASYALQEYCRRFRAP